MSAYTALRTNTRLAVNPGRRWAGLRTASEGYQAEPKKRISLRCHHRKLKAQRLGGDGVVTHGVAHGLRQVLPADPATATEIVTVSPAPTVRGSVTCPVDGHGGRLIEPGRLGDRPGGHQLNADSASPPPALVSDLRAPRIEPFRLSKDQIGRCRRRHCASLPSRSGR